MYLIQCGQSGMQSSVITPSRYNDAFCISSGAGMPVCRILQPCFLNVAWRRYASSPDVTAIPSDLIWRRHATMPDVLAMPSESHPALEYRHQQPAYWHLMPACWHLMPACWHLTAGMPAYRRQTRFKRNSCDIQLTGMPTPDEIQKTWLCCFRRRFRQNDCVI